MSSINRKLISILKAFYNFYAQQDCFERQHPRECGGGGDEDLAQKQNFYTG